MFAVVASEYSGNNQLTDNKNHLVVSFSSDGLTLRKLGQLGNLIASSNGICLRKVIRDLRE